MVGRVLRNNGIVTYDRKDKSYSLVGSEGLSDTEIDELRRICEEKLAEYIDKRGDAIWAHRRRSSGYVSGTVRYDVLKAAKFRCELCGIPAEERALDVDHIVPRINGGTVDRSNLRALCYRCNASKRDRDDTDFRVVRSSLEHRMEKCPFCTLPSERIVAENELAVAIRDAFPVTPLHTLVIPKCHEPGYFQLSMSETRACGLLVNAPQDELRRLDPNIAAFNIGVNEGPVAGQTVPHCHIHLIPRRKGDVENPCGGVLHVIPGKGIY